MFGTVSKYIFLGTTTYDRYQKDVTVNEHRLLILRVVLFGKRLKEILLVYLCCQVVIMEEPYFQSSQGIVKISYVSCLDGTILSIVYY